MQRVVVIGNSGGGKSVLARRLAAELHLPYFEVDTLLWTNGWKLAHDYAQRHEALISQDSWVIDGLGERSSIPSRLSRATAVVLVDLPLWMHFYLAAKRHNDWADGKLEHPPAENSKAPPMEALFKNIYEVDRDWMPDIRQQIELAQQNGKRVVKVSSLQELSSLNFNHDCSPNNALQPMCEDARG